MPSINEHPSFGDRVKRLVRPYDYLRGGLPKVIPPAEGEQRFALEAANDQLVDKGSENGGLTREDLDQLTGNLIRLTGGTRSIIAGGIEETARTGNLIDQSGINHGEIAVKRSIGSDGIQILVTLDRRRDILANESLEEFVTRDSDGGFTDFGILFSRTYPTTTVRADLLGVVYERITEGGQGGTIRAVTNAPTVIDTQLPRDIDGPPLFDPHIPAETISPVMSTVASNVWRMFKSHTLLERNP